MATARKPAEVPESRPVTRMRVWYVDGTYSETFNPNRPALLIAFESEFNHPTPENAAETMWLAWHALGRPGPDVDAWVETVEDLQDFEGELGKAYK